MRNHSPTLRLFIVLIACLLVSCLVCAELPELMMLIDNHSNDFTIVKIWKHGSTSIVSDAGLNNGIEQTLLLSNHYPIPQIEPQQGSSELFIVNATLSNLSSNPRSFDS